MYVLPLTPRFADLDALGHVNHATIFVYAEIARCAWFRDTLGIQDMRDLPFILASASAQYKAPVPPNADLEIRMSVPRIGTKSWTFHYEVRGSDGTHYADVETVQVAYDYKAAGAVAIPDTTRKHLESM